MYCVKYFKQKKKQKKKSQNSGLLSTTSLPVVRVNNKNQQ